MANVIPVKGYYQNNQLTTLGEFSPGDTISNEHLENTSITIVTTNGISGGAPLQLGHSITITADNATLSNVGVVQLNDTLTSNSVTLAATANTAKTLSDLISLKLDKTGGNVSGDMIVTGNITSSGIIKSGTSTVALHTDKLNVFANTTSNELASIITDETGSGSLVFGNSPTLASPTISTDIITNTTTFSIANTIATTINFGGDANNINIGSVNGNTSVKNNLVVTGNVSGNQITSTVTNLAPLVVSSNIIIANLNSDLLDGQHGSYYNSANNLTGTIPNSILGNSNIYVGTTQLTLNRSSANLALTGITSIDGSAAKLTTTRTITANTDAIWTVSFDGSANVVAPLILSNTTVSAGSYGSSNSIPVITVDSKGRLTNAYSTSVNIPSGTITIDGDVYGIGSTGSNTTLSLSNTTVSPGVYGSSTIIPVCNVDAKGRIVNVTNTSIVSANTNVAGLVQLNDSVSNTSVSLAATANSVATAYSLANSKLNSTGGTISGDLTVSGNFTVNGTTTTINTTNLQVADNIIELRKGNGLVAADGGIQINLTSNSTGYVTDSRSIIWKQSANNFQLTNDGSSYSKIVVAGDKLNALNPTTSSELAGVITDETGSGKLVFGTNPTLNTPTVDTGIITNSTTFSLVDTTATTINFGGDANNINIGASTGNTNVKNNLVVSGSVSGNQLTSTVTNLAPLVVSSNTVVSNLNCELLNGHPESFYTNANNISSGTINASILGSGIANGNTFLSGNNTWQAVQTSILINNDTVSSNITYPLLSTANTGSLSTATVSDAKLYYYPDSGTLTATNYQSLSDISLKRDVSEITNAIDILNELKPVEFVWKDSGKKSYGLIAQELELVLPELVNDNNGVKSVDYQAIIAILIRAIKELSK